MSSIVQRPGSVTAVVFLTWLAAILDLFAGVLLVLFAGNEDVQAATDASSSTMTTIGWTTLIIGVLVALVAIRLGDGGSGARMLVTILMLIRVGAAVWAIIAVGTHGATEALFTLVLSGAVLYLLWSGPSSDWFASARGR